MDSFEDGTPGGIESQLVDAVRHRHYSVGTERMYVAWDKRFVRFDSLRHPAEMGVEEVEAFLTHLARNLAAAPSTRNQERFVPFGMDCGSSAVSRGGLRHSARASVASGRGNK